MKWQRARILRRDGWIYVEDDPVFRPGGLIWVQVERPRRAKIRHVVGHDCGLLDVYLTNHWDAAFGKAFAVPSDGVELLPEFSDAADPDAEPRQ
jgi:hypothetical protein